MESKIKYLLYIILITLACSCRSSSGGWMDGLSAYSEAHSKNLSLEILRMKTDGDTTEVNYRVRIRPTVKNGGLNGTPYDFNYKMDSCFYLRAGGKTVHPVFVEAVPNGIKGCFEYLLSFNLNEAAKMGPLNLVYQDKYIDGQPHIISLNKQ